MNKLHKTVLAFFICAISCIVLYYSILFSLPSLIDLNNHKENIFSQVEKETGFKILSEDISIQKSLSPEIKVKLFHTLVLYPDNSEFIKLKDAELKVKLFPLLLKRVEIKDAKLIRPIINITMYKDFSTSLDRYKQEKINYNVNGFKVSKIITDTLCERYKLKIKDETTNKTFYLEGDELLLKDIKINDKIRFVLKGGLYENKKQYLSYDLDITAPFYTPDFDYNFSPFKTIYDSKIKGNVSGKIVFDKSNNVFGNLKLKDISLFIKGDNLENNNISLLFKGKEVDIDSVLHTSLTDEAVVKGKFNYGNSKYIDLTSKAQNVDLENLHNIISTISKSLNLPNKYKDLSVKGLLNTNFHVSSDFKTLKSSGNASIINARISSSILPYSISEINSSVNFNNNKINISNAELKVNETPISLTGVINEDVTLNLKAKSENLELKQLVKIFDLEKKIPLNIYNGKLSFNSLITGDLKNIKTSTDITLNNLFAIEKNYTLPLKIENTKLNVNTIKDKYQGSVILNNLKLTVNKIPFEAERLNLIFNEKVITIPEHLIKTTNSNFKLRGTIKNYKENPIYNFDYNGDFFASDLATILKKYIKEPYKANGYIKTKGSLYSENNEKNISLKLFADKDNYISYAIIKELFNKPSVMNIVCKQRGKDIAIKELSLYENNTNNLSTDVEKTNKIFFIEGDTTISDKLAFKNLKVSIPNKLSISTNFFGGEDISLKAELVINGTIEKPQIKGYTKLHKYNLKNYLTAIKNADINFYDKKLSINAPDVQINNSRLNISSDINYPEKNQINLSNLQINCLNLDLKTLIPIFDEPSSFLKNYNFIIDNGAITINDFKLLDIKAKDISADFSLKNKILSATNLFANAYNGVITGNINYNFEKTLLSLLLEGRNIQLRESLFDLCKLEDNISGTADFKSDLSLNIGKSNQVLNSLNGKLDFVSLNGKMGTLGKFDYYLSAQNILYYGLLNTSLNRIVDAITKDNTSQYKIATGTFNFADGYILSNNIQTKGKDMSLYIQGKHNMYSNLSDINIYGRISDSISSKLGSFGDIAISDFLANPKEKNNYNIEAISEETLEKIPPLTTNSINTKTFKVNILGNMQSLNAINSFVWTIQKEEEKEELPTFSDMVQNI